MGSEADDINSKQVHNCRGVSIGLGFCAGLELFCCLLFDAIGYLDVSDEVRGLDMIGKDLDNFVNLAAALLVTNKVCFEDLLPGFDIVIGMYPLVGCLQSCKP